MVQMLMDFPHENRVLPSKIMRSARKPFGGKRGLWTATHKNESENDSEDKNFYRPQINDRKVV